MLGALFQSRTTQTSQTRLPPTSTRPPGVRARYALAGTALGWAEPDERATHTRGPQVVDYQRQALIRPQNRGVATAALRQCAHRWGRGVLHVFDRGFAGAAWLEVLFDYWLYFLMRWPGGYKLVDEEGRERKAWEIVKGKRSLDHRLLWDSHQRVHRKTGIVAAQVHHPLYPQHPLWLVVSRPGKGRTPWYLLTNEPVLTTEDAWRVVLCYARRWQVEMSFRYQKSELAMESPRLWKWDNRLKLLLVVSLVYAFLLSLLNPCFALLREWLLREWCHRSGKRYREASVPLYRIRSALSRLWLAHHPGPPLLSFAGQNSG